MVSLTEKLVKLVTLLMLLLTVVLTVLASLAVVTELLMLVSSVMITQLTARLTAQTFVEMVSFKQHLVKLVIMVEALLMETVTPALMPAVLAAERPDVVMQLLTLSTVNSVTMETNSTATALQMLAEPIAKILTVVMVLKTMVNNVMMEIKLTMMDVPAAEMTVVMVLLTLVRNVMMDHPMTM